MDSLCNADWRRIPSSPTEIHCRTSVSFILNTQVDSVYNPTGLKEKPLSLPLKSIVALQSRSFKHTGGFSLLSEDGKMSTYGSKQKKRIQFTNKMTEKGFNSFSTEIYCHRSVSFRPNT
jgi:hypothetical protein